MKKNQYAQFEDKLDLEIPTATHEIYDYIAEKMPRKEKHSVLSCSYATSCPKQRNYQHHGIVGEPLTPRKRVNFMTGDIIENVVKHFISEGCVGEGKLYSEVNFGEVCGEFEIQGVKIKQYSQPTWSGKIAGIDCTGHPDGIGKRNSDGAWEIIEVKSAASYGFATFKKEGPGDYLKQAHALMMMDEAKALMIKDVRFFYQAKQTGNLWDAVFRYDYEIEKEVAQGFLDSILPLDLNDKIPQIPLKEETYRRKPTGKLIAQFPCSYCPFLRQCHGEFQIEFKKTPDGFLRPVQVFEKKEDDNNG